MGLACSNYKHIWTVLSRCLLWYLQMDRISSINIWHLSCTSSLMLYGSIELTALFSMCIFALHCFHMTHSIPFSEINFFTSISHWLLLPCCLFSLWKDMQKHFWYTLLLAHHKPSSRLMIIEKPYNIITNSSHLSVFC